jgi:hypothetical protein
LLVRGLICLVNSVNERDQNRSVGARRKPKRDPTARTPKGVGSGGNNRSVMPLDVLGCTRATMAGPARPGESQAETRTPAKTGIGKCKHAVNEEFLVSAGHQPVLITSLPFVHTARHYYRLDGLVRRKDARRGAELARLEEIQVVTRFP